MRDGASSRSPGVLWSRVGLRVSPGRRNEGLGSPPELRAVLAGLSLMLYFEWSEPSSGRNPHDATGGHPFLLGVTSPR
jgi:hypothetical protein